jgi:hypothetical protein
VYCLQLNGEDATCHTLPVILIRYAPDFAIKAALFAELISTKGSFTCECDGSPSKFRSFVRNPTPKWLQY